MSWKDSENKTKIYIEGKISEWTKINSEFKKISINFKGGSDSTAQDLEILKNKKTIFNIEIKENISQIGQFVTIPDHSTRKFVLGDIKGDRTRTIEINEYMNKNFDDYKKPNKGGLILKCSNKIVYKCIKRYLEDTNNKYIACKINKTFKIIHYNQINNFFSAKAIYRKKKSGSSSVPKKSFNKLEKYVKDKFDSKDIKFTKKKKFLFKSQINNLFGKYFFLDGDKYFVAKKKNNDFYRITKTSKTDNPNVIFVISMKDENKKDNIDLFKKDLLNND